MKKINIIRDQQHIIHHIETNLVGQDLLNTAALNKGSAFTEVEREQFHLTTLLPSQVETLEQQVIRAYGQYQQRGSDLSKNIYLNMLHDYNETLFYKLLSEYFAEMLPVIYTPTVGQAVQRFSAEYRRSSGLYVSYTKRDRLEEMLADYLTPEVDLIVVTDGEAVLGIGDQGIGGIHIVAAKRVVYTLAAGIHPKRMLAIQLDVGTNNQRLLNDPMYLGWRHERICGERYDDFIDQFVNVIQRHLPKVFLHWEDIGRDNAQRILQRYRKALCTFNGDMQSTGVVALASVLAGVAASGVALSQHRVVVMGAGSAGLGIAEQIVQAMQRAGMDIVQARAKLWLIDKPGLLLATTMPLTDTQRLYARLPAEVAQWRLSDPPMIQLLDVIKNVQPTILIGCSTVAGAFTEAVIKTMAAYTARPIIMPLSNPNTLSEADPADLLAWTDGQAMIATGSPFPDVYYRDKPHRIALSNNAMAFPGIGLAVTATHPKQLTDDMLWAAAQALCQSSPALTDSDAPLLPRLTAAKTIAKQVALAVATTAKQQGLLQIAANADLAQVIQQAVWEPMYYPYSHCL